MDKQQNLEHLKAEAENISLTPKDLVSISKLCKNPPSFINMVGQEDKRLVLTKNGLPVAALVPLWVLSIVERYNPGGRW